MHEYSGDLPLELRLGRSVCLDCLEKDYTDTPLTDVEVEGISIRWQKLGILRDLYLDEAISKDFEKYKLQFVSKGARYPIDEKSPELVAERNPNHNYAPDFKARFHRSLCLHSIALAARSHAVYWSGHEEDDPSIEERLFNLVDDLWAKGDIVLNGRFVQIKDYAQCDGIEIFDFVYYFLLEKVVPFSALESRTTQDADRFIYNGLESWSSLLARLRLALQPLDIVDLVKHKTWRAESNIPADIMRKLYEREHFDFVQEPWGVDCHTRYWAIDAIHQRLCSGSYECPGCEADGKPCLWDELRIKLGSPFSPGFRKKLDLEVSRVELADVGSGDLNGCAWDSS